MKDFLKPPAPPTRLYLLAGEEKFCRRFVHNGDLFEAYERAFGKSPEVFERANALMAEPRIIEAIEQIKSESGDAAARILWGKARLAQEEHARRQRLGINVRIIETQVDRGTPETRQKVRYDVISRLHNAGSLRDEHVEAAYEIHRIATALQRGLGGGSRPLDGTRVDCAQSSFRDPIDRMSAWENYRHSKFFAPWADEVGKNWSEGLRGRASHFEITRRIVLENHRPRQIDRELGVRNDTSKRVLQESLWLYAQMIGIAPWGNSEEPEKPKEKNE